MRESPRSWEIPGGGRGNLAGDLELAEEHQVPPGKHVSPSATGWRRCPGRKQSGWRPRQKQKLRLELQSIPQRMLALVGRMEDPCGVMGLYELGSSHVPALPLRHDVTYYTSVCK